MSGGPVGKFQGNALNLSLEAAVGGGAANVATSAAWPVQDVLHTTHTVGSIQHAHSAADLLSSSATFTGLLGIAAGTGISAYVNHLAHEEHERDLTNRYRPQIGMVVGKNPDLVDVHDMHAVAELNPTLDEELHRNNKMRTLRTATTLLATSVAFVSVFALVAFFPPMAALAGAAAAGGLLSAAGVGFVAASVGISFGVMHEAGRVIGKIGKKIFGLDKPTVEDHVHALDDLYKKGEHLGVEQVMGVYVASSPEVNKAIKQQFGKNYHKLSHDEQTQVVAQFGNSLPLEDLATAINNGDLNVRELSFLVHGQASGTYQPGPEREHDASEKIAEVTEPVLGESPSHSQPHDVPMHEASVAPQPQAAPEAQQPSAAEARWQNAVQAERAQAAGKAAPTR